MRAMILILALALAMTAAAQTPRTMNFQGTLTDAGGVVLPNGSYTLTFRLWDSSIGGATLWTESQSVTQTSGVFSTILGLSVPLALPFDDQYWLGVQVAADPELLPRAPLTGMPYAMNVVDGAVVKSLNGLTDEVNIVAGPNITVVTAGPNITISGTGSLSDGDWNVAGNDMSSIPSGNVGIGVAVPTAKLDVDGTIRTGTASTAGELQVRSGGGGTSSIAGNYSGHGGALLMKTEDGNGHTGIEPDFDGQGGFFYVRRSVSSNGFIVDGNYSGTESPRVTIYGDASSMAFDGSQAGNTSVTLPVDALAAAEILDEPGVASIKSFETSAYVLTTTLTAMTSRTIVCPADGYVMVIASGEIDINHTAGSADFSTMGVSDSAGVLGNNQDISFYLSSNATEGTFLVPYAGSGLFPVTAGSHTFYLNGKKNGTATIRVWDVQLNLLYVPTSYGTVEATSAGATEAVDAQFAREVAATPAPTAGDFAAEKAASEAVVQARLNEDLARMRQEMEAMQRRLDSLNK